MTYRTPWGAALVICVGAALSSCTSSSPANVAPQGSAASGARAVSAGGGAPPDAGAAVAVECELADPVALPGGTGAGAVAVVDAVNSLDVAAVVAAGEQHPGWATPTAAQHVLVHLAGTQCVDLLAATVKAGADPNAVTEAGPGVSALGVAAAANNMPMVEALLAAGADPNRAGRFAQHVLVGRAGEKPNAATVQVLLAGGMAVPVSRSVSSPVMQLACPEHRDVFELLVKQVEPGDPAFANLLGQVVVNSSFVPKESCDLVPAVELLRERGWSATAPVGVFVITADRLNQSPLRLANRPGVPQQIKQALSGS